MKEFDSVGVMVLLDGEKKGDKKHNFPSHLRKSVGGNTLPFLAVTDPSGKKPIMGFSASNTKNGDAVKDRARALRKMLREDESLLEPPMSESEKAELAAREQSPTTDKKTQSSLLAETQEWTNKDGQTIKASVKKVEAGKVYFIMDGGRMVPYPVSKLSDETVLKLKELMN